MSLVAVVGGETPLGREVRERVEELVPAAGVQLVGSVAGESVLAQVEDDEAAVVSPLHAERLEESDLVICASGADVAREAWRLAGSDRGTAPFIDLTGGLEAIPAARLRSPLNEKAGFVAAPQSAGTAVHVIAHPAASALALLIRAIGTEAPLRTVVAQVFEPASERGPEGIQEMQHQVTNLLSFRPMEKKVFDEQVAFNLVGRFGEDAAAGKLEDVEARLERHVATLLGGAGPMPSIRLIQAPVFHGHTLSLWMEFADARPELEDIEAALENAGVEVRGANLEPPSNIGVAGQSGVTAGLIQADRNHPRAVWLWAALDNYRLVADNAAAVARQILEEQLAGAEGE